MNDYELKQEARKERYEERALKSAQEGAARFQKASAMADVIPFGQPVLVGHHSESRDRKYRAQIGANMDKGIQAEKNAERFKAKAAAVGKGGISSDDPDAIEKLSKELAGLAEAHQKMKQANKLVKKNDAKALVELGFSEEQAAELLAGDVMGRKGFAAYAISNSNANMARISKRIKALEAQKMRPDRELAGDGYTYREDTGENRVMFMFDEKPDADVRQVLKRHAFKFSPSRNGAWVRQLTNSGIYAGQMVREALAKMAATRD